MGAEEGGGAVSGGQCGDAAFEALSPQKNFAASDSGAVGVEGGGRKSILTLRVAEKTRETDHQLIFFPCCLPPAPPPRSIIFFGHHFSVFIFPSAHS